MQHGNISNTPVPKVGLRYEDIIRREADGQLNRSGKAFLEGMAHIDLQIILFTTEDSRKAQAYCYKWGVPYTRVYAVDSVLDLVQIVREQNLIAYYDTDGDILSKIKERAPKTLELKKWTLLDNLYLES